MEVLINAVKVDETTVFEYVSNPKRAGFKAHARYERYQAATTLEEYNEIMSSDEDKKYAKPDLRYDEDNGHLKLYNTDGDLISIAKAKAEKTA